MSPVIVEIEDEEGTVIGSYEASSQESLLEGAEKQGIQIPSSCRSGACFVCAAQVKEGQELLDIGKFGIPLVDIEEDQVLTCVCGIKDSTFSTKEFAKIVIKKLI